MDQSNLKKKHFYGSEKSNKKKNKSMDRNNLKE